MGYANWVQPDRTSGNGNESVNVTALSQNTGRNARQTTLTFQAANCSDELRNVVQKGKPETSSIQPTAASPQTGGTVTISGKSNSSKITFALGTGDLQIVLPSSYMVNGVATNNGAAIAGDIGATQEFDFSITFNVGANVGIDAKSRQIIATDASGKSYTCTLTLAAGDAYLRVSPESIELPWDASESAQFEVESNTNWSII